MRKTRRISTITRQRVRELRSNLTYAEQLLWHHLRKRTLAGHRFRRQHPIETFIVDFVCLEARLIVEIDGSQHYEQEAYDAQRTRKLEQLGFRVLRFWNNEVLGETDAVLEEILRALHPRP